MNRMWLPLLLQAWVAVEGAGGWSMAKVNNPPAVKTARAIMNSVAKAMKSTEVAKATGRTLQAQAASKSNAPAKPFHFPNPQAALKELASKVQRMKSMKDVAKVAGRKLQVQTPSKSNAPAKPFKFPNPQAALKELASKVQRMKKATKGRKLQAQAPPKSKAPTKPFQFGNPQAALKEMASKVQQRIQNSPAAKARVAQAFNNAMKKQGPGKRAVAPAMTSAKKPTWPHGVAQKKISMPFGKIVVPKMPKLKMPPKRDGNSV